MNLILDLILILIVAYCGWRGFRTGIINGICGILAVVIAIYGANLVASAYSSEFTGLLKPFATGVVEGIEEDLNTWARDGGKASEEADDEKKPPVVPLTQAELQDASRVAFSVFRQLGFIESVSTAMASRIEPAAAQVTGGTVDAVTELLCDRICFMLLFVIAFLLIVIIFAVVGNVLDLSFGIPGHENLNHISGAVLGVAQGVILIILLTCVCRYLGFVLPDKLLERTWLMGKLVTENRLAGLLGL